MKGGVMCAKKSFNTPSGQDFECFAKKINFFDELSFNYEHEGAIGTIVSGEDDKENKFCFLASFNDNNIHFSVSFVDLIVPPKRYNAFSKAISRLNVEFDNQGTCFCAFAYKPDSDVRLMLSLPYIKNGAVERIRKAFLTIWGTAFLYRELLENVAKGRAFNPVRIAHSIIEDASRFTFLLEEVVDVELGDYDNVMALVAYFAYKYGILDDFESDDDEEEDPFNLFNNDDDSFNLFDDDDEEEKKEDDEDEDNQDEKDAEQIWDDMSQQFYLNEWNAFVDFIARFMKDALGAPFHAKSAQRRQNDLR